MKRTLSIGVILLVCGLLALMAASFSRTKRSEILISDRMSDFIDMVDRHKSKFANRLIVFDLDDTVFMSSLLVGTPTWFYTMVNLMRQRGAAKYEAYSVASKIDKAVQDRMTVVAVEQATLSAVRTWQGLGAVVVAMTSRPVDLSPITQSQLNQIGLSFSSPLFSCVETKWENTGGAFIDGVLYLTGWIGKAEVFSHFTDVAKSCGMDITLLAAADDQQRYISEIAKLAEKARTDYIGIIYGGALASRKFDLTVAKKQLLSLESSINTQIIPDEYRSIFVD